MQVRDVMTARPECIGPDDTLQQAARKMKDLDVGSVPVCDNDRLVGMLTDRDVVVRCVAECKDPGNCKVRDVMTEGINYCFEDDDVNHAAAQMRDKQIRRLVVLNRDRRLVGIVSLGDMAVESGGDKEVAGRTLEAVSLPS